MNITIEQLSSVFTPNEIKILLATYIVYLNTDEIDYSSIEEINNRLKEIFKDINVIVILTKGNTRIELLSLKQLKEIDKEDYDKFLNILTEYGLK